MRHASPAGTLASTPPHFLRPAPEPAPTLGLGLSPNPAEQSAAGQLCPWETVGSARKCCSCGCTLSEDSVGTCNPLCLILPATPRIAMLVYTGVGKTSFFSGFFIHLQFPNLSISFCLFFEVYWEQFSLSLLPARVGRESPASPSRPPKCKGGGHCCCQSFRHQWYRSQVLHCFDDRAPLTVALAR